MSRPAPDRFILTGCASGIGRHLTEELLRRGHHVLATDVMTEALEEQASAWPAERLLLESFDVRDPAGWERVLDRAEEAWGEFDVLLNIAGIIRPGEVHEVEDEDVHRHFDINVKGVVFGTRAAARRMIPRRRGHIINIASLASLAPIPGLCLYSASKFAVRGFSLAAAQELHPHSIAVTTVCPDAVATPMYDLQLDYPQAALTFTAPRVLTVEEISRLILGRVLKKRPRLVSLPWHRALLARVADLFPGAQSLLASWLKRQGLRKQAALREKQG